MPSIENIIGLTLSFLASVIAADTSSYHDNFYEQSTYKPVEHRTNPSCTCEQQNLAQLAILFNTGALVAFFVIISLCLHKIKYSSSQKSKNPTPKKALATNRRRKQDKPLGHTKLYKSQIELALKSLKERLDSIIKQCKDLEETYNSVKALHEEQDKASLSKKKSIIDLKDKTVLDNLTLYIESASLELNAASNIICALGNNASQDQLKRCDSLLAKFKATHGKAIHEYVPNFIKYKEQLDHYYIELKEVADKAKKERKHHLAKNKIHSHPLPKTKIPSQFNKKHTASKEIEPSTSTSTSEIKKIVESKNLATPASTKLPYTLPQDFNHPDWKQLPKKEVCHITNTTMTLHHPIASSSTQLNVKLHGKTMILDESLRLHISALKNIVNQAEVEKDEEVIQKYEILLHLTKICNLYTKPAIPPLQALRISLVHPKIEDNWYDNPLTLQDFVKSFIQNLNPHQITPSTSKDALLLAIEQNDPVKIAFNQGPSNSGIFSAKEKNKGTITFGDFTYPAYLNLIKTFLQTHIATINEIREKLDKDISPEKANRYCYVIQYLILIIVKKIKQLGKTAAEDVYATQLDTLRNIMAHQDKEYSVTEMKAFIDLNFNQFVNSFREKQLNVRRLK